MPKENTSGNMDSYLIRALIASLVLGTLAAISMWLLEWPYNEAMAGGIFVAIIIFCYCVYMFTSRTTNTRVSGVKEAKVDLEIDQETII